MAVDFISESVELPRNALAREMIELGLLKAIEESKLTEHARAVEELVHSAMAQAEGLKKSGAGTMTPAQTTLAMMDKARPGRFLVQDELLGFLDAHLGFARHHMGEYKELTPEYVHEVEKMFVRAMSGESYTDIMRNA